MSLILHALSNSNNHSASDQTMTHEFKQQSGSIGRSQSNDWILVDAQKYLSGQHALIEYRDHQYILTDTSTNGVFHNHATQAIGKGRSINLNDGDTLRMGIYNIDVCISDVSPAGQSLNSYDNSANSDPFSDISDEFSLDNAAVKDASIDVDDPFQDMWQDDFIASDPPVKAKRPNADVLEDHFKPLSVQADTKQSYNKPFQGNSSVVDSVVDKAVNKNKAVNKKNTNDDDDWDDNWFTDSNHHSDEAKINNHINNNTARKANKPTDNDPENANKQADDVWDEDWFQHNTDKNATEIDNFFIDTDTDTQIETSPQDVPTPPLKPPTVKREDPTPIPTPIPVVKNAASSAEKPQAVTPAVKNTPPNSPPSLPIRQPHSDSHDAMQQFLAGLQLDDKDMEKKVLENLDFKQMGELFKVSIQGTLDILHSRTHIKNEMRMDVTTIQPIENNPLKFAISADEALARLLVPQKNSYLAPKQALEEAYDDIRAHQLAVISGIQATLNYMLKRFEPKKLTTRLQKKNPIAAVIPLHRKAKLWALFEDLYETLQEEAEDDFNRLFSLEFSKAYDQQIDRLKKQVNQ